MCHLRLEPRCLTLSWLHLFMTEASSRDYEIGIEQGEPPLRRLQEDRAGGREFPFLLVLRPSLLLQPHNRP